MITYSRWKPDGGYDYFQAPGTLGIGDDLPTPQLSAASEIGVPSGEAGRAIPASARHVGQGNQARGLIAPMDEQALRELGEAHGTCEPRSRLWSVMWFGVGAGVMWAAFNWSRWTKKKR